MIIFNYKAEGLTSTKCKELCKLLFAAFEEVRSDKDHPNLTDVRKTLSAQKILSC